MVVYCNKIDAVSGMIAAKIIVNPADIKIAGVEEKMKIARIVVVCVLLMIVSMPLYAGTVTWRIDNLRTERHYAFNDWWETSTFFEGWAHERYVSQYATVSGNTVSTYGGPARTSFARLIPMYPMEPDMYWDSGVQFDWTVTIGSFAPRTQLKVWAIYADFDDIQGYHDRTKTLAWYSPICYSQTPTTYSGHALVEKWVTSWEIEVTNDVVPEPSGIIALMSGMAGMGLAVIRRKR